ncbi:MAG TPA: protein kinase [Bryobacteraceae bacterium]|nr:protein kinase [Bryobacteraceae bacterium]
MSLEVGSVLAERYEILKMLGEGGMGAVYKAHDRELDRLVALKVIRPELAGQASILQRFKQELILARKITHRNVIRIFDLGVAEGIRFITMEFVEGRDLSSLLEERKYTPEEAVKILRQVCAALEAAHAEGVVHRDLKPQNIMIEGSGRVCVMDFGLARSMETTGMTQAGTIMGTPAYMSPEQAKGMPADERSDIFSLGIIAYQMLTGDVPYKADSVLASMLLRTQGPPPSPIQVEPAIPQTLNDLVMKALAVNPEDRYQSATMLGQDLHDWQEGTLAKAIVTPPMAMMSQSKTGKWIALAVGVAVVIMAGVYGAYRLRNRPAKVVAPMTVLIADFNNHTGDAIFDGTLEPVLKIALEGATFISAYDRTQMRNLGLQTVPAKLDDTTARQIAVSQGLGVVLSGSLERRSAGYVVSARATQAVTGNAVASAEAEASNKDQVLFAATKVASAVRAALGDATSESAKRFAMETLTATSLEAVHEYAGAMELLSNGKFDLARQGFSRAVDLDPNFGLAYAGMAVASRNMGAYQDAEKYIRQAIQHIDHMTERERYRTRGMFYVVTGDQQKCVEEYSALVSRYSSDVSAHNNLGACYTFMRNMPKAIEEMSRAVEILPKRAVYRFNLALYRAYAGDFQTAEREVRAAQQMYPSYVKGYVTLAYAQLGEGHPADAEATYHNLERIGPRGASLAALGLADLAVYEGRYSEAERILEKRVAAASEGADTGDAAADDFIALANVQLLRGQKPAALVAVDHALANSKAVKFRFMAARVLVALGQFERAHGLSAALASELQSEPQVYAKLIDGETALQQSDARSAVKAFTDANMQLDTWIGRFDLGRAYLAAGAFTDADSEFDRCIKRRGEAMELFMDDVPTYGYFPPVYYDVGRVREGLKSAGFADSYRAYLNIRAKAGEDPLLPDARRRAGQ